MREVPRSHVVTPRQRMLEAFAFAHPERLPVYYSPSPAGLHVHGEKLLELFRRYPPDNWVKFDAIPEPAPGTVDDAGVYHEFRSDEFGTIWEFRIFGVHGHPYDYAIDSWDDPLVFPAVPSPGSPQLLSEAAANAALREEYLVFGGWISLFEKLCALRPFGEVLMDLTSGSPPLLRVLDRLVEYQHRQIDRLLAAGTEVITVADDWGMQQNLLMRPEVFRRVFKPRIRELIAHAKSRGGRVLYHTCGAVYPLFDDLVECGIDALWHQIGLYDPEGFAAECARKGVVLFLHMDRQYLIPRGTPTEIRETVLRYVDLHQGHGGGAVLYIELENDVPFANAEALVQVAFDQGR